jgi:hypothetical protein
VVRLLEETLGLFRERRWDALARRIHWVLRLSVLEARRPRVSPDMLRVLNMNFDALDPSVGLYFRIERAGGVDGVPSPAQVALLHLQPPPGRARARTRAIRAAGSRLLYADWDEVIVRSDDPHDPWGRIRLAFPMPFTCPPSEE